MGKGIRYGNAEKAERGNKSFRERVMRGRGNEGKRREIKSMGKRWQNKRNKQKVRRNRKKQVERGC